MTQRSTVVPPTHAVTEDEFHGAMVAGLGRAEQSVGRKALAFIMDVSLKQLGNIFGGSAPHPKRLWDALAATPTALDDIAALYGVRVVDKEATCDTDNLNLLLARALVKINEATHPSSPGGRAIVHSEYLDGEEVMRALHKASGDWLQACADIRKPRAVA